MLLYLFAYVSGLLTVLAPCVLPLVPAVLSGSFTGDGKAPARRAAVIILSLMTSIIFFSLALRTSFAFLPVSSDEFLRWFSGGVLVFLGVTFLFPRLWWGIAKRFGWGEGSQTQLMRAEQSGSWFTPILIGFAFGPVFSACSPVYGAILFLILPAGFLQGLVALIFYVLGVGSLLFAIAFLGQKLVHSLEWATDPHGPFRKIMGVILILIGLMFLTEFDKVLQSWTTEFGLGSTTIDAYFLEVLGLQ